jgi:Uma2 family endonuclease
VKSSSHFCPATRIFLSQENQAMQTAHQTQSFIPEEEYLAGERTAQEKHEWYQGECFAMAGGTRWHNLLAGRVYAAFMQHLAGDPCTPYMADFRLHIEAHQHYVYPDVMVICDDAAYLADDMVNDAAIIIEVLSRSTESYDRGRKFLHYQSLPSLQEYVLISQDKVQVEIYCRKSSARWEYERLTRRSDILLFKTIDYAIPLDALYQSVPTGGTGEIGEV